MFNSIFSKKKKKKITLTNLINTGREMQSFAGINVNLFNNLVKVYCFQEENETIEAKYKILMCLCFIFFVHLCVVRYR